MTDIKELALKVAIEVGVWQAEPSEVCFTEARLTYFAQRFLAAYLAEQEPRGWWNPSYPSLSVQLTKPYDGGGWEPFFTAPPLPEPAPQEAQIDASHSPTDTGVNPVCAAPSSEEVREMVERHRQIAFKLRKNNPHSVSHALAASNLDEAADLIERLAGRVPDGCVVVSREPTLEMVIAGENYVGRHAYKAMIAAGEIKP